jgi:hypothetical protein
VEKVIMAYFGEPVQMAGLRKVTHTEVRISDLFYVLTGKRILDKNC